MLLDQRDHPIMFYNGADRDGVRSIGWVVFDHPNNRVLDRCEAPLIAPPGEEGGRSMAFAASLIDGGDRLHLYFHTIIAVAAGQRSVTGGISADVDPPPWETGSPQTSLTRSQTFSAHPGPMSPASFSIEIDPPRDLVRIRLSGFFSVDDVTRFEAELLVAHRRLGCSRKGGPLTINDISGMAIQSQDVVARWGAFLANPAHRSRRLAFVVGSTLARMQLQRVIGGRDAKVFTDEDEAEQWLFAASINVVP